MDLSKALAKILEGSSVQRINKITNLLKKEGAVLADDLIYFDWKSLKELGDLSTMEISLIMEYIQENTCETDATQFSFVNHVAKVWNSLPEEKMKFEKEVEKGLKEQQEMEEQLKHSQEQSNTSKGKPSSWAEKHQKYWEDFKKKCAAMGWTGDEIPKNYENDKEIKNINVGQEFDIESHSSKASENVDSLKIELKSSLKNDDVILLEKFKKFDWDSLDNIELLKFLELFKEHKNIEEVISEIFAEFSNESRINKIIEILHEDDITRAGELSCFDWKLLQDLGLTSSEATRIMDFVKEKFPKHYKKHEKRRDDANKMQEELLKQAEINVLLKSGFHGKFEEKIKNDQQIQVTEEDFKEIELPIEEAVAKILDGCNTSRMIFVTRSLMEEGAQNSKELKYFNRNSLEELGILEKEEIDKILKFIQES